MNAFRQFRGLRQADLDRALAAGVSIATMIWPEPILLAFGDRARDGRFDENPDGAAWLVFQELEDFIFWNPDTGELATWFGRAFALGEESIWSAGTYSFGGFLNVFASPIDWLRAMRDGIVIVDWDRCFDQLRDAPRIAVAERLLSRFRRQMTPPKPPELFVMTDRRRAA